MRLLEVPATGTHHQGRGVFGETVDLGLRRRKLDRPSYGVDKVYVSLDNVLPCRREGVFKIGHEDASTRVESVDHHLALDRTGDLAAPVLEVRWGRCDQPVPLTDFLGAD